MKKLLIVLVLPFLFLNTKCRSEDENCHRRIIFDNKSDKELFVSLSYDYPDSISNFGKGGSEYVFAPREVNDYIITFRNCIEKEFGWRSNYGILMLFIFDNKVLKSTPNDTILKYRMYLKKYDLTVDTLQKMNWTVTYP